MSVIIEAWLRDATLSLKNAGIESARLDALILLEDALKLGRASLLAHPETKIPASKVIILNKKVMRRAQHEPLAYIRGHAPFYGRNFSVGRGVLVPRPETESLIELLKKLPLPARAKIADVGTGSGCVGITAALEITGSAVWLIDIDQQVLSVAAKNAKAYHANTRPLKADLLEGQNEHFNVILANLPYVPELLSINKAATFEPRLALFSGADGLDAYKRFWHQVANLKTKPAYIITEALPNQHHMLATLARSADYYLAETLGFAQSFAPLG